MGFSEDCEYRAESFGLCADCAEKYVEEGCPDGEILEVYYPHEDENIRCEECDFIINHGLECWCPECVKYCAWCGEYECNIHCQECGDNQVVCGCNVEESEGEDV